MVEVAPIEEILIHIDPDLDYGPDWMPEPSPPVQLPVLGARGDWSDVFDWVKEHAILPEGAPVEEPWATPAQVQAMVDAGVGSAIKALSGFMNRTAAMTIEAASILEDAIDNLAAGETTDFRMLSQHLDRIQNVQDFIVSQVIPTIFAQFDAERATMLRTVAAGDELTRQWTETTILAPLVESLGQIKSDLLQVIDLKAEESHQISAQQVAGLGAQLAPAIAAAAALGRTATDWIDDCGEPMCQTMGPKTDLGKLLKALKLGAAAVLLAELASLDANEIEHLMSQAVGFTNRIVSEFGQFFSTSGETLGDLITGLGG